MNYIKRVIKSNMAPDDTHVLWIDTSKPDVPIIKLYDNGWEPITGDLSEYYQKPEDGIPESDLSEDIQTLLGKADTAYQKPVGGIPESDLADNFVTKQEADDTYYQKPNDGIPKTDMTDSVQDSLELADSSLQYTFAGEVNPEITPADYVTVEDIVDNLITNDATKVLSAKQGKVLNDNLSELNQAVDDLDFTVNGGIIDEYQKLDLSSYTEYPYFISSTDKWASGTLSTYKSIFVPIIPGDSYKVSAKGQQQTFIAILKSATFENGTDPDYATGESGRRGISEGTDFEFTASVDAYYIAITVLYNGSNRDADFFHEETIIVQSLGNRVNELDTRLSELESEESEMVKLRFQIGHELADVSSIIAGYRNEYFSGRNEEIEWLYDKFDSLVSTFPEYITKVDAADECSLSYPEYANLNGQASGDYLATPTYKTYLYKFIRATGQKKKKLFLVGGVHGVEKAAPANLYILAYSLCYALDANVFNLANAFDIYILPCLNGYGMYHNNRRNANNVDINRNFPFPEWERNDSIYTGATAGSEFETQLVMAEKELINPDLFIDHHSYDTGAASTYHLYGEVANKKQVGITALAYRQCAFTFLKELPQYFGDTTGSYYKGCKARKADLDNFQGTTANYFNNQGTPFAAIVEIGSTMLFTNGEAAVDTQTSYGNDVFAIADYTLKTQLYMYGEIVFNP